MSLQAMRQALEFVEKLRVPQNVLQVMLQIQDGERVITALRIAIEQAEKAEPVAWVPQFSWMRSIDAVACKTKRSFDDIPLYTHPVPIPAGWQLVPVDPTKEMLQEGRWYVLTSETYKAMLAAAPKQGDQRIKELEVENAELQRLQENSFQRLGESHNQLEVERLAHSHDEYVLEEQLAASQAREQALSGKLYRFGRHYENCGWQMNKPCNCGFGDILSIPSDDTALREYVRKEQAKLLWEIAKGGCTHIDVERKAKELEDGK